MHIAALLSRCAIEGKTRYNHAMSETVKLSTLIPDMRNANLGTPRGSQMIEDSLRQYGAGRSILIDKHGNIVAGNKTVENAAAIGMDDVIVVQSDGTKLVAVQRTDLDLDDPHTRQLAIADNRSGQVSLDWDADALKGLVEDGVDLAPFWTADELAAMWPQTVDLLTDEDDVPPVPVEPVSKLGDLYIMGDHRLLCGDSTVLADVERLMGGQKADMVFTDPPYGVSVHGGRTDTVKAKNIKKIANDELRGGDLLGFLRDALGILPLHDKCAFYLCYDQSAQGECASLLKVIGWTLQSTIVWNKNVFGLGTKGYRPKFELIAFGYSGSGWEWFGGNAQSDVWDIPRPTERPGNHPTPKPVELCARAIENSSKPNSIIVDLFGGSGSTLIACEKTNRKCYMMELSPAYCDVIVARWEQATGKKAVLSAG